MIKKICSVEVRSFPQRTYTYSWWWKSYFSGFFSFSFFFFFFIVSWCRVRFGTFKKVHLPRMGSCSIGGCSFIRWLFVWKSNNGEYKLTVRVENELVVVRYRFPPGNERKDYVHELKCFSASESSPSLFLRN